MKKHVNINNNAIKCIFIYFKSICSVNLDLYQLNTKKSRINVNLSYIIGVFNISIDFIRSLYNKILFKDIRMSLTYIGVDRSPLYIIINY